MAEQTFYVEDTVCLKSNANQVGVVERSFSNVETHSPNPQQETPDGILIRGEGVDLDAFNTFLSAGVPPKSTVLVTWVLDITTDGSPKYPTLIRESELRLLDRTLIFGDVVKRNPLDPMSGIVIQANTTAAILQPWAPSSDDLPWRPPSESYLHVQLSDLVVCDIPVEELKWANEYERDDVIVYGGWVGQIQEIDEDVYIRLSNNTVVVPEDSSELRGPDDSPCHINQDVTTRKANLRRGKWIYGAYDANVEPRGIVVDTRPKVIAVQWLASKYPKGGALQPPEPPLELERREIESGEVHVYDRRKIPASISQLSDVSPIRRGPANLDIALGDRVRFRDLDRAIEKYGADSGPSRSTEQGTLNKIKRERTLGFDLNVSSVVAISTSVDILWQDGTIDRNIPAKNLSPYLDLDNEEEVWPGEFVMTKEDSNRDPDYFVPARAGIVQSVNAKDRMARVKWFDSSKLTFTRERPTWLMPGSYTSKVSEESEEISLYDIFTTPDTSRRLGDLVVIVPSPVMEQSGEGIMGLKDVERVFDADPNFGVFHIGDPNRSQEDQRMWVGEIVELGLDGLLTIRLGACEPPQDVRVPWECTHIAYSSDQDEATDGFDSLEDDVTDGYESDDVSMLSSIHSWDEGHDDVDDDIDGLEGIWRDASGNEIRIENGVLRDRLGNTIRIHSGDPGEDEPEIGFENGIVRRRRSRRTNGEIWRDEAGNEIAPDDQWSTDDESQLDSDDEDVEMSDASSVKENDHLHESDRGPATTALDGASDSSVADPAADLVPEGPFSYENMFPTSSTDSGSFRPAKFAVLDGSVPPDHHYAHRSDGGGPKFMRQIQKEHKMLQNSLPDGAYVRTWESKMNMMRILLLGPIETPYEYAPFVFDFYLDPQFPRTPPEVFFHSWTDGRGPCNPNLYEDGKVCLSLLGTWPGDERNEGWNPGKSSILQVIVSLLGLVLVREPYYNEAGFEVRVGTVESQIPSAQYSERTLFRTRRFIAHALEHPISGFEKDIELLYLRTQEPNSPKLLFRAIEGGIDIIHRSRSGSSADSTGPQQRKVTAGALAPLTRQIEHLLGILSQHDAIQAQILRETLNGGGAN